MKKGITFVLAMLLLGSLAWAQSTVKLGPDGKSLIFIYDNPDATQATIAGTFNGWNPTATKMTKRADGKWEFVLSNLAADEEVKFKFLADEEWDQDSAKAAPASADDGFGGLNGVVSIAMLQGGEAAASPSGKRIGLSFGSFHALWWTTTFVTQGIDPTVKGLGLKQHRLNWKWYPKIQGYGLEWFWLFVELQVVDKDIKFLDRGLGDTMNVSGTEGIQQLVDVFAYAPYAYQPAQLGHFKTRLELPYTNIYIGHKWAKLTADRAAVYYNLVREADAGNGIVEISSAQPFELAPDVTLAYTVAPNRSTHIGTNYGLYSWVELNLMKAYKVNFFYGFRSAESNYLNLDDMLTKDPQNVLALGVQAKPISGLTIDAESMIGLRFKNYLTGNDMVDIHDTFAGALRVKYEMKDVFGITAVIRGEGDFSDVTNIYGKDMKKGKYFFELNPYVVVPMAKVGLDSNYTLDNQFDENADINLFFKPYANIDLGSVVPSLKVNLYAKLILDLIGKDKDVGFKFEEVNLETVWESLVVDLTLYNGYAAWDAVDKKYPLPFSYIYLIGQYKISDEVGNVQAGLRIRMPGADATEAAIETNNLVGVLLGYWLVVPMVEIKKPFLFAKLGYNFTMWDGDDNYQLKFNDDGGRPDAVNQGNGDMILSVGLRWDF